MARSARTAITAVILALGASGIAAQTLLLRELLVLFGGNEFSIGAIIGNWVVAGALGSLAGSRVFRLPNRPAALLTETATCFSLLLPVTVIAIRNYKLLAGLSPDLGVGIGQIFLASLLLLLPIGFINGLIFVVASTLVQGYGGHRDSAGRVYILLTIGTIAGGLLATFILIPLVSSLTASALVLLINGLACLCLWIALRSDVGRAGMASALVSIIAAISLLAGGADWLHQRSISRQWVGKELLSYRNSPYQNIVVVGTENQYTIYSDGLPFLTLPDPDIAFVEEFVHLPLLAHPHPAKVLVLGGGAGGVVGEILKHPSIRWIDCVELDPMLLSTIIDFAGKTGRRELDDPRVRLIFQDGRFYLRDTVEQYDVVLLGMPLPLTLSSNRYFSEEFFRLVRQRLFPEGIVAVTAAGSNTYYGRELRETNSSLRATLSVAFPWTMVVPGDVNLLLASNSTPQAGIAAPLLAKRLQEREIAASLISPEHLQYLFSSDQQEWYDAMMTGTSGEVNRDFSPRLLVHYLSHATVLFSPALKPVLDLLKQLTLPAAAAISIILSTTIWLVARRKVTAAIPWAIATTGFTGMVLELVLIIAFQVFQGAMFHAIGLLLTTFMGGLAGGSLLMTVGKSFADIDRRRFLWIEGGMALLAFVLALSLSHAGSLPAATPMQVYGLIVPLLVISGFLTGAEFPLAVRLHGGSTAAETSTAGFLYGADLLGGWLGGIIGGTLLVQNLGPAAVCFLLGLLKCGSLLVVKTGLKLS